MSIKDPESTTNVLARPQEADHGLAEPENSEDYQVLTQQISEGPPYSIHSDRKKLLYAWIASVCAFASPVTAAIYYPAIEDLARDLNTSIGAINLTITTYLIFQGITPTFVATFADRTGRRPAFIVCFIIYIGANIGLALQSSYPALLILRCLQSAGSSGTIALASGVVADLATRDERGRYIGLAALGSSLGPTLGPVIGGLLDHFLGWRAIFWFLAIYAGCMLLLLLLYFPETSRNVVGNGSVPPARWNRPLVQILTQRKQRRDGMEVASGTLSNVRKPGLLTSVTILFSKEAFCLLAYGGLVFAGFYIVLAGLATQLSTIYSFNSIQTGLCYLPMGFGAIVARQVSGRLIDAGFHRYARNLNIEIKRGKQTNIDSFPVERARLEIALPFAYAAAAMMLAYGWVLNLPHPPLAAVLVLLFLLVLSASALLQASMVLTLDCYPDSPSSASAALNLSRCLLGAAGVAALQPVQDAIGFGWTATLIAGVYLFGSALLWLCWFKGMGWRAARRLRCARRTTEKAALPRPQVTT